MKAKELFTNAFNNSRYNTDEIIVEEGYIQYNYSFEHHKYFLRIINGRIINGRIGDDGKSYAEGLPISVLSYIISHYKDVESL